ncbi:MAG: ankyrin repeat domain-containing protein [Puniceicoccales bacterium]|jgi:hypothetical protein|nr:ankyrin repeat domain-containing protein [Puniceicoccales bacterium]
MKRFKISSLLLGTFLMPMVSFGSADFGGSDGQFAGVVVSDDALFDAIKAQNMDLVNYLLDRGANPNARMVKDQYCYQMWHIKYSSPLVAAIQSQNIDMVCLLLDYGAQINDFVEELELAWKNEPYIHYLSPLVVAIRTRNIDMVRLLLARGANVNTKGGNVNVPLYEAVNYSYGQPDIIRLLLEQKGINVNIPQNTRMDYDEYESRGYAGEPYDFQVPETALKRIGNTPTEEWKEVVRSLREKGAR